MICVLCVSLLQFIFSKYLFFLCISDFRSFRSWIKCVCCVYSEVLSILSIDIAFNMGGVETVIEWIIVSPWDQCWGGLGVLYLIVWGGNCAHFRRRRQTSAKHTMNERDVTCKFHQFRRMWNGFSNTFSYDTIIICMLGICTWVILRRYLNKIWNEIGWFGFEDIPFKIYCYRVRVCVRVWDLWMNTDAINTNLYRCVYIYIPMNTKLYKLRNV